MTEIRNIVLIGRTGNGKSTLGNVLLNKGNNFQEVFKESEFGVSQTHETGIEEFEINSIKYRIIDTVGIGDTSLNEQQVLYKIADAAYKVRDGLNQILFVTSGRFTEEEITAYDLLRTVIFDGEIVKYTTIVRTNFSNFRNYDKCEMDRTKMISENSQLKELIKNCKNVIHVDNSPLNIDDEDEKKINLKKRGNSRDKLLTHLAICQTNYKPKNLENLNSRIGVHMTKIEMLEKQLKDEKKLSEVERKQMQSEINELRGKVSHETKGVVQKFLGATGELAGKVVDKTVEVAWSTAKTTANVVVEKCNIM